MNCNYSRLFPLALVILYLIPVITGNASTLGGTIRLYMVRHANSLQMSFFLLNYDAGKIAKIKIRRNNSNKLFKRVNLPARGKLGHRCMAKERKGSYERSENTCLF